MFQEMLEALGVPITREIKTCKTWKWDTSIKSYPRPEYKKEQIKKHHQKKTALKKKRGY